MRPVSGLLFLAFILAETSVVSGNINVGNPGGANNRQAIAIRIGDGSVVKDDINVRTERNKVLIYLSGGGKVLGKIRGAEVTKKKTKRPVDDGTFGTDPIARSAGNPISKGARSFDISLPAGFMP